MQMEYKKSLGIAMFAILAASSFTFLGAFPLFNVQEAEAQGLQLRVSAAEKPEFENHFFGAQIVQIVIDDPGATDPDESTVGLIVLGATTPRVHLSDGLWYSYVAEDQGFGILMDVLTDGARDNNIDISKPANDAGSPVTIGGFTYVIETGNNDSFVAEIEIGPGVLPFVQVNQADIFTILPAPFFETAGVINPDLRITTNAEVLGVGEADATPGACLVADGGLPSGAVPNTGDGGCDWPFIKLVGIEELSTMEVRAGTTASVVLIFDDLADSITAGLDRTTDYPLNAELINNFVDFMWNINPVEEDAVYFALDTASGENNRILFQPIAGFDPAANGQNFADITDIFTSSPGMEFDERQVLELDPEGVNVVRFTYFLDVSTLGAAPAPSTTVSPVIGQFAASPFTFVSENARLVTQFDDPDGDTLAGEVEAFAQNAAAATIDPAANDVPVIGMFEGDPNVSIFDNTVENAGGRSTVFTGTNDRVASFDYFDIIASAPMTTHDGFTSVDREVYDSADRAVFTVTDPDQNLRSRISEEPTGRESNTFIRIGSPFPLVNTRQSATDASPTGGAGISNVLIDTIERIWVASPQQAIGDATTFGIDAGPGLNILADANSDDAVLITAATGTERFHADDTDIVQAGIDNANRRLAAVFTPPLIGGSPASTIVIDTKITLDQIDDFNTHTLTGAQILGQVYPDNLQDATFDQFENFLTQVAEIDNNGATAGGILGQDVAGGIIPATSYTVRMPKYNLIHVDLTDLQTTTQFRSAIVKIEAVDPTCIPANALAGADPVATPSTLAFDDDLGGVGADDECVHAAQIVDFQIVETAVVDTNASTVGEGDIYNVTVNAAGVAGSAAITPWNTLQAAGTDVGFDRDRLNTRSGDGAFRVLDLARVADANFAGNHLLDRIRVTIMLLDAQAAPEPAEVISAVSQTIAVDIGGLGTIFDVAPNPTCGTAPGPGLCASVAAMQGTVTLPDVAESAIGSAFSNLVYRLELDEEGSNSSIFTGRMDFETFFQFDTVSDILSDIVLTGDPLKAWLPNRFIPPNRLALSNLDEDIVQFFREVSATFIYETRDGSLEWDRSSFSFGQDAFLTITDEDLNRRPDSTERFNLPVDSFVFFELGKARVDTVCVFGAADCFFNQIDATLLETGPNTGTFVSQITMPRAILTDTTPGAAPAPVSTTTQQRDLEANYIDIRDRSSVRQEFDDITNIRTTLGDVVLDRAAYPPAALMFVEVHDNDFNTDVDIRENIDLRQFVITADTTAASGYGVQTEGATLGPGAAVATPAGCDTAAEFVGGQCTNSAPIAEITVFRTATTGAAIGATSGRLLTLLPVGIFTGTAPAGPTATAGIDVATGNTAGQSRFGVGVTTTAGFFNILPILDRTGTPITNAVETGPNTGIFEFETRLPGPVVDTIPPISFTFDLPNVLEAGTVEQPVIGANLPIQVTYEDPADESGEAEDEEELATFLFNTARLRTDKLEYGLGEPVDIIIEEPDFNLDSRSIDEAQFRILDIITDKFDTEDNDAQDFGTVVATTAGLRTNLTVFRETGFNTGVFAVQIEEIVEALVDRGEDVEIIYRDETPSGGRTAIRVEYEFLVVEILPEIIFDKEEYTPFDEFIVSIISPDSNQDPDRIETIRPIVSTSTASLGRQSFPETGPNTGIFEEDFDLSPNPAQFPGDIQGIREDGLTVEFRIDEDTVATKSVFINYHVGQVMFDKDAFRISERGVLRVIDPDSNRNPDTIDTTDVRFWSTTDRGGLLVTLRETGDRTGIFEEIITFTPDEESTGTRLRVTEGDTITGKYTDNTLPAPAALDAQQTFTVEVEELFASALIGARVPPLERAVASEPELVDQTGQILTDITEGSQVLIQSEIVNSQTKKQPFAYIVQIKDDNGVTISLSWVTGELPAKESLKAAQSWIPDASGDYTVEIFVWESVDNPVALSPVRTTTISVS
jgi:hypothetical protein